MHINNIRKILLGVILSITVFATYMVIKSLNKQALPIEPLKAMSKSVDIEIENFKVTHQGIDDKEWEIKAKEAQVKNEENKILLTDVNVTLNRDKNKKSTISADSGTIDRDTKDIELEGHVKFKANAENFFDQFEKKTEAPQEPKSQ